MNIVHSIYIYNHESIKNVNKALLTFIFDNKDIISNMNVNIKIFNIAGPKIEEFINQNSITIFPILITNNKVYKGIKEIITIYRLNINEYKKIMNNNNNNNKTEKIKTENIYEDNDDDDDNVFESNINSSIMDSYKNMLDVREKKIKNIRSSNLRIIDNGNKEKENNSSNSKMFNKISNQNINNEEPSDRNDNIINDDIIVNIDPTKIEKDGTEDPNDDIIEKAYWSRISLTS